MWVLLDADIYATHAFQWQKGHLAIRSNGSCSIWMLSVQEEGKSLEVKLRRLRTVNEYVQKIKVV